TRLVSRPADWLLSGSGHNCGQNFSKSVKRSRQLHGFQRKERIPTTGVKPALHHPSNSGHGVRKGVGSLRGETRRAGGVGQTGFRVEPATKSGSTPVPLSPPSCW